MPHILVENLVKTYLVAERRAGLGGAVAGLVRRKRRVVTALDGISFSVDRGELLGYIGPNGAGKSTTVKILSGILVPDSGRCEVDGRTPWRSRQEHVKRIGVVFGQRTQLWWDLPVVESFDLLRDIYRVPDARYRSRKEDLVDSLGLAPLLDVPVRQLSLGQRMRCDLAAALLHEPELLFLDEPTIGLDAVAKLAVRDFVRRSNRERKLTVILTTHDLDDIEALCSRLLVISAGRIVADCTIAELRRRMGRERRLVVELAEGAGEFADPDARVVSSEGRRIELAFDPLACSSADLVRRIMSRYPVRDLAVENSPIEEIVAELYRSEAR
jgi:ABC-2 type transport system ATP-binding protein